MFLSLVRTTENKYFVNLHLSESPTIAAHKTLEDALYYWEEPRRRALSRGCEGAMSAVIHSLLFEPSIVEFTHISDFLGSIGMAPATQARTFTDHTIVGPVSGLWAPDQKAAAKLWRGGRRIRLP